MMIRTALLMIGGLALAACGGGSKQAQEPVVANEPSTTTAEPAPPPLTETQVAMAKMNEFKTAMCACTGADCAKAVSNDMTKWSQEQADKATKPLQLSEDEMKLATELGTQMGECMMKAMGSGE